MSLPAYALTDFATVATELPASASSDQALIERLIGSASRALDRFTNRSLIYQPGMIEPRAMYGGPKLLVDRTPILVLGQILIDSAALPATDGYWVHDSEAGIIWRTSGWYWSALIRDGTYNPNFQLDQAPGTEEQNASVAYGGGYITGPQCYGAAAWPGANSTVQIGQLCKPTGRPTQIWVAAPVDPTLALTTGGSEPAWPASPTAPVPGVRGPLQVPGSQVTDGNVQWSYLGTAGSAGSRGTAVTLPDDLEEACILAVKGWYRARLRDPAITQQSLGEASYTWDTSKLSKAAQELALPYVRTV